MSAPLSDVIPIACFVSGSTEIVPSQGAFTMPIVGTIAHPFPKLCDEKASSFTVESATTFPESGDATSTDFTSDDAVDFFFRSSVFVEDKF